MCDNLSLDLNLDLELILKLELNLGFRFDTSGHKNSLFDISLANYKCPSKMQNANCKHK